MTISNTFLRITETTFAIISCMMLGVMLLLGSTDKELFLKDDYEITIEYDYFLFGGHQNFYVKENMFLSKWIGSCTDSDNNSCSVDIKDNQLIITERWYRYDEEDNLLIEKIKLK
jgi:hypothetical protein